MTSVKIDAWILKVFDRVAVKHELTVQDLMNTELKRAAGRWAKMYGWKVPDEQELTMNDLNQVMKNTAINE